MRARTGHIASLAGFILAGLIVIAPPPAAAEDRRDPRSFLFGLSTVPPEDGVVSVCHAYGCTRVTRVRLSAGDTARMKAIMSRAGTAQAERAAVARVIAGLEKKVGAITGTSADRDYRDLGSGGDPTQMDCLDEAANSTSYLLVLAEMGLLRHHEVAHPVTKGHLFDFIYPHTTAVLVEKKTGHRFAVDSWVFTNGEPPIVTPLDTWFATKSEAFFRARKDGA